MTQTDLAAVPPAAVPQLRYRTLRTIVALVLREMTTSYGRSPGGYLWAVVQPVGMIVMLSVAFSLLLRSPSLGTSFILFYSTGILPLRVYQEVAGSVSLRNSGPLLIVDFDLVSAGPVDIVASYSDQTVWFNGFAQLESPGANISAESGRVTMQIDGKRRYALFLHNAGDREVAINLQFRSGGNVVHDTEVTYTQRANGE